MPIGGHAINLTLAAEPLSTCMSSATSLSTGILDLQDAFRHD